MTQKQMHGMKKLGLLIAGLGLLVAAWWLLERKTPSPPLPPLSRVIIALPTQVSGSALYVAQDQDYFKKHGIDMKVQAFALGKQALQSVLQGKADLAVVADTPFMFAIMHGEKVATVSSLFGSRKTMGIVARKDRGIARAEDLRGKTVGTIFGTNAQYFLDTLLLAHGVEKSSVTVVDMAPDKLVEAMQSGAIDAVTVWNPDLAKLEHKLGSLSTVIYDEDIFVYRFLLVGTQDYIARHPAEVRQVLAAIADGVQYIQTKPAEAQVIVGKSVGMDPSLLSRSFEPNDFYLSLDQTLLLAMGNQTRWAMKQGIIPSGAVPNFLDYIRQEPLRSVQPSAIKIIH